MPPLAGWPAVVRSWAVLLPAFALSVVALRPWQWQSEDWDVLLRWEPDRRVIAIGAAAAAFVLFWIVYSRFQSGHINGVDFTIYFVARFFRRAAGVPSSSRSLTSPHFRT